MPWPPRIAVRSLEPADKIRALTPFWRERRDTLRSAAASGLRPIDKLAAVVAVSAEALQQRRIFRRYLVHRFGYDPLCPFSSERLVEPVAIIAARGRDHIGYFIDAVNSFRVFSRIYSRPTAAGERVEAEGGSSSESIGAAWDELLAELDRGVLIPALATQVRGDHALVLEQVLNVSAWAAANLSLTRNRRLRAALSEGEAPPEVQLLTELPTAVFLAASEVDAATTARSLLSGVARGLEQSVPSPRPHVDIDGITVPQESQSAAADAAAELVRLRSLAHLTQREAEVLDLRLEGYKEREIADLLGIQPGTVKATAAHARDKLRDAGSDSQEKPGQA